MEHSLSIAEFGEVRKKNPAIAVLLSLILPGLGHLYCGKRGTGTWTLCAFLLTTLVSLYLISQRMADITSAIFPAAVTLYVFAAVDAFLTAREATEGRDRLPHGNPRIAMVLNFLTCGMDYFYVGHRITGLLVFVLLRPLLPWLGIVAMPVTIGLAVHAYLMCETMYPQEKPPDRAAAATNLQ